MITIWPYLRLSVGFQGHFEWTSSSGRGERRMSSFLSHSGRVAGIPPPNYPKIFPLENLPLFLSFSPANSPPPVTVTSSDITWNERTQKRHYCLNIPTQTESQLDQKSTSRLWSQLNWEFSTSVVELERVKAILRHYPEQPALWVESFYYSEALWVESYYPQLAFVLCCH